MLTYSCCVMKLRHTSNSLRIQTCVLPLLCNKIWPIPIIHSTGPKKAKVKVLVFVEEGIRRHPNIKNLSLRILIWKEVKSKYKQVEILKSKLKHKGDQLLVLLGVY